MEKIELHGICLHGKILQENQKLSWNFGFGFTENAKIRLKQVVPLKLSAVKDQ